jgi:hypothetical protein
VGAVGGAKGIVHVGVRKARELLRERGVVRLLFGMEAQVLEHKDIAGTQRSNGVLHFGTDAICSSNDRQA